MSDETQDETQYDRLDYLNVDVNHHNLDELSIPNEIEHTHDLGIFFYIIIICICSYIGTFDTEIRCALGNQQKCATMQVGK